MTKTELLNWLREELRKWEVFLDQIDPTNMDKPNVVGYWSMKDVVAHLTGWNRKLVARLQAAQRGEPEPLSPWPAHLQTDDEINAWHYETNRTLSIAEVLKESDQVFQQLFAVIEELPDDVQIDTVKTESGREFYLVWIGTERYLVGEFFDHFRDDHEQDIRAWLAHTEKP
jgi:hypothetical protein